MRCEIKSETKTYWCNVDCIRSQLHQIEGDPKKYEFVSAKGDHQHCKHPSDDFLLAYDQTEWDHNHDKQKA